jgi:hypothetical protein
VTAPSGTTVSVDGQAPQTGSFTTSVSIGTGQEMAVVATSASQTKTWYARCLPSGFPSFSATVSGHPQAQYYLTVAPAASTKGQGYLALFDDHGDPIWWKYVGNYHDPSVATVVSKDDIALAEPPADGVINLHGQQINTITSPAGPLNNHDVEQLPNGDFLVIVSVIVCCTDLSSWGSGFPSRAPIRDDVIEELTPSSHVVRSWSTLSHINPLVETASMWHSYTPLGNPPSTVWDVFHANSVSYANGNVLVSYRYLNAVYDINWATGAILWKLGGHKDADNLSPVNDPVFNAGGGFCGQHDARDLGNGTITVYDDGTNCHRAPRGVAYSIDTTAGTATLAGSISDPKMAPQAGCCGSARLLPRGDWVLNPGANNYFTELTPGGTRVYLLQWTQSLVWSFRTVPILPGVFTAAQLRNAMNFQYPRNAPANRSPPHVSGTPAVGHRLTASRGRWFRATSFRYRWEVCRSACVKIAGADGRRLRLKQNEVGAKIRVVVTGINQAGRVDAHSPKVGPVRS